MRKHDTPLRAITITILAISIFSTSPALSQSSASVVSQDTRNWAAERLDEAEAALADGNAADAFRLVESAADAPTRRHGRGVASLSARSLGSELYDRVFDLRHRVRTALGREAEKNGLIWGRGSRPMDAPVAWDSRNAIEWYLSAMNPDEILRLVTEGPEEYEMFLALTGGSTDGEGRFTFSMGRLESYSEPLWNDQPRPRELELQETFQSTVVPAYKDRVRSIAMSVLASEAEAFEKPLTDMEKQYDPEQWQEVQEAFTGVEAERLAPTEVRRKLQRTRDSKPILREAVQWFRLLHDRAELAPLRRRAEARGDTFMAIGDDTTMPVLARSDAYDEAGDYYYIGRLTEKSDVANEKHMGMTSEVEAYVDERRAMEDAAEERMQEQAAEVEAAIEDMTKSEEEKKAFEAEADALEDELDFDFDDD